VNDFEEMQQLYVENVPRYNSVPVASNKGTPPSHDYPLKYMPNQAPPSLTYPKSYMQAGAGGSLLGVRAGDEERPAEKQMTNLEVIDKIDVIIKELDHENILDRSALDALGKLKLTL